MVAAVRTKNSLGGRFLGLVLVVVSFILFSLYEFFNEFFNIPTALPALILNISIISFPLIGGCQFLIRSFSLTIFNFFIFKFYNKKNFMLISKALQIQAFISIGFILFTILTSNPFRRLLPPANDGLGFNPILQDPALAIHPPLLYIGYVGLSAAFSISVATLSLNNNEKIPNGPLSTKIK